MVENVVNNSFQERKDWIDIIRGLAVVLVVIGHAAPESYPFFLLTSPIKMPLFFVISGYLFNARNGSYQRFFKNLLIKVIIPWFFLGLTPVIMMAPFKGISYFTQYFLDMLSGQVIWFMPCFVIAETVFFTIKKCFGAKFNWVILCSLALSVCGYYITKCHFLDYAMINRALTVQIFLSLGALFRLYEEKLLRFRPFAFLLLLLAYIVILVYYYFYHRGESIDVHMGEYINPIVSMIQIIVGCWLVFSGFRAITKYPYWLTYPGKNSLIIYIWSSYGLTILFIIIGTTFKTYDFAFVVRLLVAIITCILCCIIAIPLNKYLPLLVGKSKR